VWVAEGFTSVVLMIFRGSQDILLLKGRDDLKLLNNIEKAILNCTSS
jgi:hypothetical protein